MKIILNGRDFEMTDEPIVSRLLVRLEIPQPGTAVAVNGAIISRDNYDALKIEDGDRIDILRAIGGG